MTLPATPERPRVLVIDDEPDLRTLYEFSLVREGYEVHTAEDVAHGLQALKAQAFDAVITDMRLPDGLGLEIVKYLTQERRVERCVVITAFGSAENAVEALKAGAFDYLTKPVDLKQFRSVIAQAVRKPLAVQNISLTDPAKAVLPASTNQTIVAPETIVHAVPATGLQIALARLVGSSAVMCAVRERIQKVASSMAPVLVRGESGTGKELVARAIHACSHRAQGTFIAVNCGAIPENLLEAEFFGARKGAYTGAVQDRVGYFQAAHGGTLFLDEIGDLPLAMQAKLLRAIQERSIRPLGSSQEEHIDTRILSATHHDLAACVARGTFRQDLYYRLNVIEILLPALRERSGDLPQLAQAILERITQETQQKPKRISVSMLRQLQNLPLEGNVRELENLIHRALALSELDDEDLHMVDQATPPAFTSAPQMGQPNAEPSESQAVVDTPTSSAHIPGDLQAHLDGQERNILLRALNDTGFNRTAAAARLGMSLRQIRYRMVRLGIEVPTDRLSQDGEALQ